MSRERMRPYTIRCETTDDRVIRVIVHGYSLKDALLTALDHEAGDKRLPDNLKRLEVEQ